MSTKKRLSVLAMVCLFSISTGMSAATGLTMQGKQPPPKEPKPVEKKDKNPPDKDDKKEKKDKDKRPQIRR